MLVQSEFDKQNTSTCVYNGQVLAALKMPGGQLPWDLDLDMPVLADDFDLVKTNIGTFYWFWLQSDCGVKVWASQTDFTEITLKYH